MKDRECSFSGLVAGSVGYLKAKFTFSSEWDGCKKAASFWLGDQEYAALLNSKNECIIPPEALTGECFKVSVTGVRSKDYKIDTNKIKVTQEVR
jgi:hypothetical protein